MNALRELVAAIRVTHAAIAVRWCRWDVDQATARLDAALTSQQQALAEYRLATTEPTTPANVPAYLTKEPA